MAYDPSIFAQANRPSVAMQSPFEVMGQAADVQNKLNSIRQVQAQQAVGQAYQQATGPDGTLDVNKLRSIIAQDPRASMGAQDANLNAQTLGVSQQAQAAQRNSYVGQAIGAVLDLPDNQMHDGAVQAMQRAIASGITDQATGLKTMAQLSNDPAQLRTQLRQIQLGLQAPGAQQEQIYGTPAEQRTGPNLVSGVTASAARGGGFAGSTSTRLGLDPATATAPTTLGVTPKGATITGTRKQFVDATNSQPSPLGTGRMPTALLNPSRPGAAPAQPGIVTSLGPAQDAAQTATGSSSAKSFADITDQGLAAQGQNATLGNMLGDASNFTSGMTKANDFKTFVTRQAPAVARAFGIDPDKVAANESFDKLAAQIAGAQGAGSDARLAVAQSGNPSSHLTPAGVDQILRQLQGNADYNQARSTLAAAYPDKSDRSGFEAGVGSNLDPRAFQFQRMTGPQKTAYVASLSPADRARVQASYNYAASKGLIGGGQ